jgi:ABC-type multidrug transport system ATPase subunit
MAGDSIVKVHGLGKRYSLLAGWALKDVSLTISPGEVYGLIGENGAGKTTLIRIILGLIAPTKGQVSLSRSVRLGYVPEQPSFYHTFKVREHLYFTGGIAGLWGKRLRRRVEEVLETVDLSGKAGARVGTLSRGMLQRLGIAQAILDEPELVVMDEPAGGLDPLGQKEIRDLIALLNRSGKTILFSSHYLVEIERVCHRVGILHRGVLALDSTLPALVRERKQNVIIETDAPAEKLKQLLAADGLEAGVEGSRLLFHNLSDEIYYGLVKALSQNRIRILELKNPGSLLEEVFIGVTGERRDRC